MLPVVCQYKRAGQGTWLQVRQIAVHRLRPTSLPFFFLAMKTGDRDGRGMEETIVTIETNQGPIELKLYPQLAPKTCENFVGLIKKGYYDGIIFHRIIPEFMLQCGDPTGTGRGGESIWGKAFEDECTTDLVFDKVGLLAMANSGPNTNGSQFFITTAKTPWLNMRHTIFGEVTKGYEVVEKIEAVPRDGSDKPIDEQKIVKATVA